MLNFPNLAAQVTTITGTGGYVMGAAVFNSQTLDAALTDGEVYAYRAYFENGVTTGWEIGLGTWASGTSTLARTTIIESTNGDAAVSWAAGNKIVEIVLISTVLDAMSKQVQTFALGDEDTDTAAATAVLTWTSPNYPIYVLDVYADVKGAPTGAAMVIDVNDDGSTLMSTNKITIDAAGLDSKDAATQPGITSRDIAARSVVTVDVDQVGSTAAGNGAKLTIEFKAAG